MVNITEKYAAMPSSKHSGRRSRTQMLVVHSAESPLQRGYAKSLTNWSNTSNVQASWNAFVDPGVLVRAVNTFYAAWHASWANSLTVGYETAAYAAFSRDEWMTLEGRRMLERLAIEMAADAEIFDIPLRWLTGSQVNAVRAGNTKIKGLAAHRQVDPDYRTDPGDGFPYGYLLKRIKAHTAGTKPAGASAPQQILNPLEEIMALDPKDREAFIDDSAKAAGKATLNERIGYGKDKQQTGSYILRTDRNVSDMVRKQEELLGSIKAQSAVLNALASNAGLDPAQVQETLDRELAKAIAEFRSAWEAQIADLSATVTLTNQQ